MTALNLSWRSPLNQLPREGQTYQFSTYFLWALRNEQMLNNSQWTTKSEHWPYGNPGKEAWEGKATVNNVEKIERDRFEVQFSFCNEDAIHMAIEVDMSGQCSETGCLKSQYPFSVIEDG